MWVFTALALAQAPATGTDAAPTKSEPVEVDMKALFEGDRISWMRQAPEPRAASRNFRHTK